MICFRLAEAVEGRRAMSRLMMASFCLVLMISLSDETRTHADKNTTIASTGLYSSALQRSSSSSSSSTDGSGNVRRLTVSTILDPPYMMLKPDSAFLAGNERFEGYLADILKRLATSVGFEYEIRLSRDGKHGDLHMDRIWDGMMGDIQRGDADLAAGALIITDKRREYFDFTEPFLSLRSSALIRKPQQQLPQLPQQSRGGKSHKGSSSSGVRVETTGQQQRHRHGQSTTTTTPSPSTRTRRIHTADQLLGSELTYGVVRHSVVERSMSGSADPLTRALWSRIATFWPPALVDSVQEGVERARRDQFAFIVDSPMAAYVAGRPPCDLYTTEPFLDPMTYAFAVRRPPTFTPTPTSGTAESSSSATSMIALRHSIDVHLRRLKNSGEMQAMYLRWWRDECGPDLDAEDSSSHGDNHPYHIPDTGRYRDSTLPSTKTGRHVPSSRAARAVLPSSSMVHLTSFVLVSVFFR